MQPKPPVTTRYLYPYPQGAGPKFYVSDDTVYEMNTGKPLFYIRENVVYACHGGQATYWIGDKYLHEYGSGEARFYFSDVPDRRAP